MSNAVNNTSSVVTSGASTGVVTGASVVTGVSGAPVMNEAVSREPLLRCQALNHVYKEGELETQVLKGSISVSRPVKCWRWWGARALARPLCCI